MLDKTVKLVAMRVVGNAFGDRDVWAAAYEIVEDVTAPAEDRIVALAKMNELTGLDDPCTLEAAEELRLFSAYTPRAVGVVAALDDMNPHSEWIVRRN